MVGKGSGRPVWIGLVLTVITGAVVAQDSKSQPAAVETGGEKNPKIIPIVALRKGETKKILLSTACTVGVTRGGGFEFAEMRDGVRQEGESTGNAGASFQRDGVNVSIPDWGAATRFASSPPFASLYKSGIHVFEVTVVAEKDAKPGLLELHLLDATCNGHCQTDFRVVVTE